MARVARIDDAQARVLAWGGVAWLPDLLAGGAALIVAVLLSRPLLLARDLQTGAGDWPAQVYRVQQVLDHGFQSWTHAWAGGMPLWAGYQAIPHVVTVAVMRATGLPTTQAMAILAGVLLVTLRVGVYAVCRRMGAPPLAALAGALAMMAFDTARQPVANYSELWGLALAPFALYAGYRWAGLPGGFVGAALIGIGAEVHPLLAIIGGIGFAAGYLASPRGRSPTLLAGQALVAAAGAAAFWLPVVVSTRPAYLEPYYTSAPFARLLFRLSTAGFPTGWPLIGFGAVAMAAVALDWGPAARGARFALIVAAAVAAIAFVSLERATPDLAREAQLVRLVGVAPILLGLVVALVAARAGRVGGWTVALACVAFAALAVARGAGSYAAVSASAPPSPLTKMIEALPRPLEGRVYADAVATATASAELGDRIRFAGSYSGREWSIVQGPLTYAMGPLGSADYRTAYLVAHGVEYAMLPAGARPAIVDPFSGAPAEWQPAGATAGFELLRVPWATATAWLIRSSDRDGLVAPEGRLRDTADSYARDVVAARLGAAGSATGGAPIVGYPTNEAIEVRLRGLDGDGFLVVNENWDTTWRATADGRRLRTERLGLNQIGVDLAGLRGDVTVTLRHQHPWTAAAGLAVSIAAVPFAVALMMLARRREKHGGAR